MPTDRRYPDSSEWVRSGCENNSRSRTLTGAFSYDRSLEGCLHNFTPAGTLPLRPGSQGVSSFRMAPVADTHVAPPACSQRPLLLVVAADNEARAVIQGLTGRAGSPLPPMWTPLHIHSGIHLVLCGVGKAPAAAATAAALARTEPAGGFTAVLSLGIGGVLPATEASAVSSVSSVSSGPGTDSLWQARPSVGDIVLGDCSILADEGVETDSPGGFVSVADMGFLPFTGHTGATAADPALLDRLRSLLYRLPPVSGGHTPACFVGPVATVSVCSGTDARAATISARTGGLAECMEGAAVGLAASVFKTPFAEVRVISNRTGRREAQSWDIKLAMATLTRVSQAVARLAFSDR